MNAHVIIGVSGSVSSQQQAHVSEQIRNWGVSYDP